MKQMLATLLAVLVATVCNGQDITVKGHVKDASGLEVIGANIIEKGNPTNGTTSDLEGNFTLTVPDGATLAVSFIGYVTQEVKAAPTMVITLQDDSELLDEVVVIGYGTARKDDLTGSVSAIKPDDMNKGLNTSAQDMMSGKIAGVNVQSNGGTPGGGATIRIRGGSSLNASNDPLIVIDGLPMDSYGMEGNNNPLSLVNPADIESFTVLKDASATAIYGSRASNGVILITTKRGRTGGKTSLSYNGNISFSTVKKKLDVLNTNEYIDFMEKAFGYTHEEFLASPEYAALGWRDAEGNQHLADTDWQNQIFRTVVNTDHNLTLSGSVWQVPYRVSVGYTIQNGILEGSDFERLTGSMNLSPTLLDNHLKLKINLKGMYSETSNTDAGAVIGNAISMDPTKPIRATHSEFYNKNYAGYWQWPIQVNRNDNEWRYGVNTLAPANPVSMVNLASDKGRSQRWMGNIEATYQIHGLEDLSLHLNMGMDLGQGKSRRNKSPYYYDSGVYYYGNRGWNSMRTSNHTLSLYTQYMKQLDKNQHIDAMVGYEWQHFHIRTDYFYSGRYPDSNLDEGLAGTLYNPSENTLYKSENYLVSFFGRVNYSLMNRYLLTFTLRNDGSSRFNKGHRWGVFPSVALAWKMSEENFLKDWEALDELKLRLGYGVTGQQEGIGDYTYFATYTPNSQGAYYPAIGEGITYRPAAYNKELTWEKTATFNAGIDFSFFNNRLSGSVDYYYRKTKDLINNVYVSAGSNFSAMVVSNIGSLHNQGMELALTWRPIQNNDWYWELGYNLTYNMNQIDELLANKGDDYTIQYGGAAVGTANGEYIKGWRKGHSASAYYTYQQVYDEQGLPIQGKFVDRNKDGIINSDDRYFYKQADAKVLMGFTSKVTYKQWDLGISMRASLGNYVYNAVEASRSNLSASNLYAGEAFHNVATMAIKKGWQEVTGMDALSDYFIQNGAFLKLDNITLGYSFDKPFGLPLSGRAYMTAQNIFTITGYKGLDPEVNGGYDGNIYPRPFTGIMGISLNF
ncbi:MAG: TonB-dependent receptor [Mediterranea massiliensis]|nr:TonB-dependent receptor [Mediterranea massiliensis]